MSLFRRLSLAFAALRQLGPCPVGLYAWYQLGLRTGYLRRKTNDVRHSSFVFRPLFEIPDRDSFAAIIGNHSSRLLGEADEIVAGRVRLFGGEPVPLKLGAPGSLEHWTVFEQGSGDRGTGEDIKFVWEPGRFGWAYTLGRAYYFSGDERYAQAFWERLEEFLEANPPNLGPHWVSAQEVALRLIAQVFAALLFARSPGSTPRRMERLAASISAHAARIPPTLAYARAQNNNHLLSEAAGLYTAGLVLPGHPQASEWQELGWLWLNEGLQAQIAPDGTYSQHSTNYHRLALQIALWCHRLAPSGRQAFPAETRSRLAAATRWLLAMIDLENGRAPNLGPNDGAYIQPLSTCPFADYRPVVQAAARAFLGQPAFPPGPWDEMSLWYLGDRELGDREQSPIPYPLSPTPLRGDPPYVLRSPDHPSWAYFRVARFTSRPGHADQLHLDLWWRGLNIAQDPGTFQYNAPPPWENPLAGTAVHNTVTVNGRDQMRRAGRFLWLDWAQGKIEAGERGPGGAWLRLLASQNGYRHQGIKHEREVNAFPGGRWRVVDRLKKGEGKILKTSGSRLHLQPAPWNLQPVTARLHWLLPDWEWRLEANGEQVAVMVESPHGPVELRMRFERPQGSSLQNSGVQGRHQGTQSQRPGRYGNQRWVRRGANRSEAGPVGTRRHRYLLNTSRAAGPELKVQIVRAGEVLYGDGQAAPTWGWSSPTYGVKIPALSVSIAVTSPLPICLASEWIFPAGDGSFGEQPGSANPRVGD